MPKFPVIVMPHAWSKLSSFSLNVAVVSVETGGVGVGTEGGGVGYVGLDGGGPAGDEVVDGEAGARARRGAVAPVEVDGGVDAGGGPDCAEDGIFTGRGGSTVQVGGGIVIR